MYNLIDKCKLVGDLEGLFPGRYHPLMQGVTENYEKLKEAIAQRLSEILGFPVKPKWAGDFIRFQTDEELLFIDPNQVALEIVSDLQRVEEYLPPWANSPEKLLHIAFLTEFGGDFIARPSSTCGSSSFNIAHSLVTHHAYKLFNLLYPQAIGFAERLAKTPLSMYAKLSLLGNILRDQGENFLKTYKEEQSIFYDPEFRELELLDPAQAREFYEHVKKVFDAVIKNAAVVVDSTSDGTPIVFLLQAPRGQKVANIFLDGETIPLLILRYHPEAKVAFAVPKFSSDDIKIHSYLLHIPFSDNPKEDLIGNAVVISPFLGETNLAKEVELQPYRGMEGFWVTLDVGEPPVVRHGYCNSLVLSEGKIVAAGEAYGYLSDIRYRSSRVFLPMLEDAKAQAEQMTRPARPRPALRHNVAFPQ